MLHTNHIHSHTAHAHVSTRTHNLNRKVSRAGALRCSAAASATAANAYQAPGRYGHKELSPITNVRVGGDDELPINGTIKPTLPAQPGLYDLPLVVMSSGFLLPSSVYTSYAHHLASHGYAVLQYDFTEVMDDVQTLAALRTVINAAMRDNCVGSVVDPKCLILFGHSRGAKLSCLLAESEKNVRGLALLDPVDNTSMTPAGDGFPSSLPALRAATKARNLPVLVVGAAMNGDIIPAEGNYKLFTSSCRGPMWEVDLLGAGHLSFLDKQEQLSAFSQMASMLGRAPPTSDASASIVTKVAVTAWLNEVVRPYAAPSIGRTSAQLPPPKELERSLYDSIVKIQLPQGKAPRRSTIKNLSEQPLQGSSSSGSTSSSEPSTSQSGSSPSSAMVSSPLYGKSEAELLQMRARELKDGLVKAGVKVDDCFEKQDLVRRVLEACGKS